MIRARRSLMTAILLVAAMASAAAVHAQVAAQLSSMIGNIGFNPQSKLIEFLVFFTIFTSIAMLGLNKFMSGNYSSSGGSGAAKALAVGLGAAMSFAMVNYSQQPFGIFMPFVKNVIFWLTFTAVYMIMTKGIGMQKKWLAWILALIQTWLLFNLLFCLFPGDDHAACDASTYWDRSTRWLRGDFGFSTPDGPDVGGSVDSAKSGVSGFFGGISSGMNTAYTKFKYKTGLGDKKDWEKDKEKLQKKIDSQKTPDKVKKRLQELIDDIESIFQKEAKEKKEKEEYEASCEGAWENIDGKYKPGADLLSDISDLISNGEAPSASDAKEAWDKVISACKEEKNALQKRLDDKDYKDAAGLDKLENDLKDAQDRWLKAVKAKALFLAGLDYEKGRLASAKDKLKELIDMGDPPKIKLDYQGDGNYNDDIVDLFQKAIKGIDDKANKEITDQLKKINSEVVQEANQARSKRDPDKALKLYDKGAEQIKRLIEQTRKMKDAK